MKIKAGYWTATTSVIAIVLIAVAIFVVNTLTDVEIAAAVLYAVVVLMAGRVFDRRGVVIVALGCIVLTVVAYLLSSGNPSGTTALANLFLAFLAIGATTFLALRDQSAQKAIEQLASIVASSDDAIISKDLDGLITSWNAAATRILGYEADEMIGQPITRIIPTELHAEEMEILARLQRGERIHHVETVRVAKDGRLINMSITASPRIRQIGKGDRRIKDWPRHYRTKAGREIATGIAGGTRPPRTRDNFGRTYGLDCA